jgi:outer membrane protein assembly factor BamD
MAFDNTRAGLRAAPLNSPRWLPYVRAVAALLLLVMATACASTSTRPPAGTLEPDKFLWERGTEALNERRWFTAREFFRTLVDSYPQSTYRADAKLGVADSFLGEGTIESSLLAINEYREFLSFYPGHKRADYAQFKLGMTHYYQMRNPQRDQTETREAIAELSTFVQRYPGSDLIADARKYLREARDRLGDSEYSVGYYYYRSMRWYPGAIERFVALLREDPEFTHRDAVYFYLAQSLVKIGRPAEALPYLDKLLAEFEQSEYLEEAKQQVATLKAEMAKKVGSPAYTP